MDYRCWLGSLGKSSTASASSDLWGTVGRAAVRPLGHIGFLPAVLLFIFPILFLPPSSVSMSYFILAAPKLKCLGKPVYMSFTFPIATLNGTCMLSWGDLRCG